MQRDAITDNIYATKVPDLSLQKFCILSCPAVHFRCLLTISKGSFCCQAQLPGSQTMMIAQLLLVLLVSKQVKMSVGVSLHPFDLPKFRPVLSQCRLQCPSTSPSTVSNGSFEGVTIANHFYTANDNDALVLSMRDPVGSRCELRHNPEWSTTSTYTTPQTFRATLRFEPDNNDSNASAVTLMQIHSKNFLSYVKGPPLMLGWHGEKYGKRDHLWAKIRMNLATDSKSTKYFDLGPLPRNADFVLQVTVQSGILSVWVDNVLKATHDWHYLDLPQNYFKTGVYIHGSKGDGPESIEFRDLYMGAGMPPVQQQPFPTSVPTAFPSAFPTKSPTVVDSSPSGPRIARLVLVNAERNQVMTEPSLDTTSVVVLDRTMLPSFTIAAQMDNDGDDQQHNQNVGSVVFRVNGMRVQTENFPPYCIAGDQRGNYHAWHFDGSVASDDDSADKYVVVSATAYTERSASGMAGPTVTVTLWIM